VRPSTNSAHNYAPELRSIVPKQFSGFLVKWIVWVWLQEQKYETIYHGADGENGFPVLSQNVEANVSVRIDVRMIYRRFAFNLRGIVGIHGLDCERESEAAVFPEALIGSDMYQEMH
jgi:hypothetical protein